MLSDSELLDLLHRSPEQAWELFIERYAGFILSTLRALGFGYDQAMDRFVYICAKLCENDFRRLRSIRHVGSRGDLVPWLREVIRNLCVNWAWSEDGRRRLFTSIARLGERDRRIFELYFWKGESPSEIHERLRCESGSEVRFADVLEALERIFLRLGHRKLWRLVVSQARRRAPLSLDVTDEEGGGLLRVAAPDLNPEEALLRREAQERMTRSLAGLPPRERLVLLLRYEEGMAIDAVAGMLHLRRREVQRALHRALETLRGAF